MDRRGHLRGLLIGLGSLVVADLPKVDTRVSLDDFVDKPRLEANQAATRTLEAGQKSTDDQRARLVDDDLSIDAVMGERKSTDEQRARLVLAQQSAHATYANARRGFDNWIATRTSTQRADQDPEIVRRTRELDDLNAAVRRADAEVEAANALTLEQSQKLSALADERAMLDEDARKPYEAAVRSMELRVFLIRLAITLPPLVLAGWLFARQRKSAAWPFVWGFVFFAGFTFFVELVPYLPSYGGYVRYVVGLVITVIVGRWAMVAMQRYLERQRTAEQQSESVRRQALSYEHAIKSMNAGICPGCERGYKVHDGATDFCMHCGMKLFEHCPACAVRRNAFFHFCPGCGTAKPEAA